MRNSATLFVQSLEAPDMASLAGEALAKKKREPGSRWTVDKSLSPADLYIWLKARFGPPNGIIMTARSPSSDNFIQWHYTLRSGTSDMDILGLNTRTEIMISGYANLAAEDWAALVAAIKKDFGRMGSKLKEVRGSLEHWQLFYNPYKRLDGVVQNYYNELGGILAQSLELPPAPEATPLVYPSRGSGRNDLDEYGRQVMEIGKRYARAQELSTCLRLLCPVWAEAFVNFLIFMLARAEFKKDSRLYQDFLRKDIDVRIKLFHINCDGFERPINADEQPFKDFHSLMNERNDVLHGNIDPKRLSYETVYFDGTIPLFTEPQSLGRTALENSLRGIEPVDSLKRVEVVLAFIAYVLGHLKPDYRKELMQALSTRDLGWREETKRVGILFGDAAVEGFLR